MNISEMFSDSYIEYPFSNLHRMVGLGLLLFTSFLIIPGILAGGYLLRIVENTIKGNYELPPFENWKKMFIDGLKVAAVVILFILPGLISEFATSLLIQSKYALILNGGLALGLFGLTILVYAFAYILSITAIPRMAYKNQLKAAFEIKKIIKDIMRIGLKKYALSLGGFSIMAAYLILLATYFLRIFTYMDNFLVGLLIGIFAVTLMVYSLLVASQGRLMGLIYLEGI
jgi:hypothetical protein